MKLSYKRPAEKWTEALPLGNGQIGAMVFGHPMNERIALNDDTFWAGFPKDKNREAHTLMPEIVALAKEGKYGQAETLIEDHLLSEPTQSYLPLGDLCLAFSLGEITDYSRELDLSTGLALTQYQAGGVTVSHESFVSYPDQVFVLKITATAPLDFKISLKSKIETATTKVLHRDSQDSQDSACLDYCMEGFAPEHMAPNYLKLEKPVIYGTDKTGLSFCVRMRIHTTGQLEQETAENGVLVGVVNAKETLLVLTSNTNFERNLFQTYNPEIGFQKDLAQTRSLAILNKVQYDYESLKQRHIQDHQSLFNLVSFRLAEQEDERSIEERLLKFDGSDKGLYELLFQYGRYLLIASSREGTQPANLQGIWNEELQAPWSSNYTVNINTEMNYWPAESCNLPGLHQPLFELIKDIRIAGRKTATQYHQARGYCSHHNIDLWRSTNPVGNWKNGSVVYAYWPLSSAWLCRHLFEHYEYTLDEDFLREAYPLLKEAALFFLDTLVEDGAYLSHIPSTSPENRFIDESDGKNYGLAKTTAMTMSIIRELFLNCIQSAEILKLQDEVYTELKEKVKRLRPLAIGSKGQILEWDQEYKELEPTHRHISHLYALHPANLITLEKEPELAQACKKSLELRGDEGTGWSLGWKINQWARLQDGDHALRLVKMQLRYVGDGHKGGGSYLNLFDAHPPFQIDGNFGATAGIAEFFVQSYEDRLLILPALPSDWDWGSISGLRAKKALTISLSWNYRGYKKQISAKIKAEKDTTVQICLCPMNHRFTKYCLQKDKELHLECNFE